MALQLRLNPIEVSEARWFDAADLISDARACPERYAPWLLIYLERWDELKLYQSP